jgi:hypothetical protein
LLVALAIVARLALAAHPAPLPVPNSTAMVQHVLSAQQQAALLVNQVNSLVASGILNAGNGNALTVKLNAAMSSLDAGNKTAGVNQLNAFINQVQALSKSGKLTASQAKMFIDAAGEAIASA